MDVEQRLPRVARGITLVELITTLAVVGISLAVVVPGWSALAERSRVTTTVNSLVASLRLARSTAVTRRQRVTLCPSDDGARCSGDPHGWQRGYLVFRDDDGNRTRATGEPLLRVTQALPDGIALHSTSGRPAISFTPDGAAWATNTTFSICTAARPNANRAVVLYGSGRARVDSRAPGNRPIACP